MKRFVHSTLWLKVLFVGTAFWVGEAVAAYICLVVAVWYCARIVREAVGELRVLRTLTEETNVTRAERFAAAEADARERGYTPSWEI